MLTGQYVRTHGVWMNGVPLPADAPSVAAVLHDDGYRTALFGKAHFEPFLDPTLQFAENRMGVDGTFGPHRGFEHMETATHTAMGFTHYARMMMSEHVDLVHDWYRVLDGNFDVNAEGGGDTGAAQVWENAVPRDLYHTDWVAQRTIAYLDTLPDDVDFFVWVSFPDPHHPWDPPASEKHRVDWRDLDLPDNYPRDATEREAILDAKPKQWRGYYDGTLVANYEAPRRFVPAEMTADQVREVNAMAHIENELIDEACAAILQCIGRRGWDERTDVFYTTDHGELQGDFGLLFKGAYHCDALMRLPLIWRPAPGADDQRGDRDAREPSGRPARSRAHVVQHRGRAGSRLDGGAAAPDRRSRRRRARVRARGDRVGQHLRSREHASAHDLLRRLGLHGVRARFGARRHRG